MGDKNNKTHKVDVGKWHECYKCENIIDDPDCGVYCKLEQCEKELGLYGKYRVFKTATNQEINDFFVLRPKKDHAAIMALLEYAKYTNDELLAKQLLGWMINVQDAKKKELEQLEELIDR